MNDYINFFNNQVMTFGQDFMDEINHDFMYEFNQDFMNELIRSIRSSEPDIMTPNKSGEPDIMTPSKSGDHYKFDMTK